MTEMNEVTPLEEATAYRQLIDGADKADQPTIDAALAMRSAAIRRQFREGATVMQLASDFKMPPVEIIRALEKRQ